jgi:hypothetical protein
MAEPLYDGTLDFSLGQDAWHLPDRIQPNQYAKGVNVTTKGGGLRPRPPYTRIDMEFDAQTIPVTYSERTTREFWCGGKFQAALAYVAGPDRYILTVVNGIVFQTNIKTGRTAALSLTLTLNPNIARINWSYADKYIVFFDYPDYPIIYDGMKLFRSNPENIVNGQLQPQVPISTIGTFNQNRLFISNAGTEFTAGDPVGNLLTPEAPITFTEVFTPSSPFVNQFFSLPTNDTIYPITAMGFIQQLDSSTGIGAMFVATAQKFYFFNTQVPRDQWSQGQFGGILINNAGVAGQRAVVNVNSDLLFMTPQAKIHALSTARNEARKWGNVPISREVENWLKLSDPMLSQFAVMGYFNNRIYCTANPYRTIATGFDRQPIFDYTHGGLVVLEIENLSSLVTTGVPCWAGLWTGVNPMEFVTFDDKAFIISKDGCGPGGENAIYEITENVGVYDDVGRYTRPIRSVVETRGYDFKDPYMKKWEQAVSFHIEELEGELDLLIERRPRQSHEYLEYGRWKHNAGFENCGMPTDAELNGIASQSFSQLTFGEPKEKGCSPITSEQYRVFEEIQLRLTILGGRWLIPDIRMKAEFAPHQERQVEFMCKELPEKRLPLPCDDALDWGIPEPSVCP